MSMQLFHSASTDCSRAITRKYSTSFSSAINLLHPDLRGPIHDIYGFVRVADEIVDSFHAHDRASLLEEFKDDTYAALAKSISVNPILHSFQRTVHRYGIGIELIDAFFRSMASDLTRTAYDQQGYEEYIHGSAEVVGLMCLHVFCDGDKQLHARLKGPASALGAAFQKVNFLRDIQSDVATLSRMYFPGCDPHNFSRQDKEMIEKDIEADLNEALKGILALPMKARFGVYVAYRYYHSLFRKIRSVDHLRLFKERIRIPDHQKALIVLKAGIREKLGVI